MAISTTTLLLSAVLFISFELHTLSQRITEDVDNKAILIAENIASSLIFQDAQTATETITTLHKDSTVKMAAVYDKHGTLFASFIRDAGQHEDIPAVGKSGVVLAQYYVEVFRPVVLNTDHLGTVFIRSDLTGLKKKITQYGYIVVAVFFLSLLLAIIISQPLQRLIYGPVLQLARLAEDVSENKNYSIRLEVDRDDELGTLIDGFNTMLGVIEDRERQLKDHTDHLEHLVHLRSEQLHKRAYFDSLTELPNRNMLYDRLSQEISRSKRERVSFALMFLDLDRFKTINDSLGHDVGDELLCAVAKRLLEKVRKEDIVARLGGDEFVVLLTNISSPEDIDAIAKTIKSVFSRPFKLSNSGATLHITSSIGISIYPNDGDDAEALMKNADASMYVAKKDGAGQYCFYKKGMNAASHRQLEMENHLRHALLHNEFHLFYQPQVRLKDNTIYGLEALIRWTSPQLGEVYPSEFIPLAEEVGLLIDITSWVSEKACLHNKMLQDTGIPPIIIAVNISASHLMTANIVDQIKEILDRSSLDPRYLELEITEDIFLDDSERIIMNLKQIKELGVQIVIDDFGTGYSSLSYLQKFPVDTLKLDGSFIQKIGENHASEKLISATINLAHSLDLNIVAECVETQYQWDFLKEQGCDFAQGYFFCKPLAAEEIKHFLEQYEINIQGN
ncbi:MAG: EAL domain-containing protein [Gammaproteobacteria bacterium]|nr:EAL domain-containing protein [Gammaproteobacteria bacterium]